ncbi:GUN4 domain-containing protein [Calothrix membranacea FACHB-236]|nr:GUN4 domain-containing protein [Calothrix membranacea FACHB-236]
MGSIEAITKVAAPSSQKTTSINLIEPNFAKLRDLLAAKKWIEANLETSNVMLSIACPTKGRWLDCESIKRISCEDFYIIDKLWSDYSNGRFGFSAQKFIWKSVNGNADKFGNLVGWRVNNSWIKYSQFTFSLDAPQGHLPHYLELLGFVWKSGWLGDYWDGDLKRINTLVSRLENCHI